MPRADQLPESIQRLVAQNGWEVHYDPYFTSDIERVAVALERWVPSLRKRLQDDRTRERVGGFLNLPANR